MNNKVLIAGVVVIVFIIAGVSVSRKSATAPVAETPNPNPTAAPPVVTAPEPMPPVAVHESTVVGSNFKFVPSSLTVKQGEKVRLTFQNSGGMHDLRIDELGVATKKIGSGATDVVEFTPDKKGTFEFYCSVGDHRAMGMKGTITVQ